MEPDEKLLVTLVSIWGVAIPAVLAGYAIYKRAEYMGFPELIKRVRKHGLGYFAMNPIQEIQEEESNSPDYETINKLVD